MAITCEKYIAKGECKACSVVGRLVVHPHTELCKSCSSNKKSKFDRKHLCVISFCRKKACNRSLMCSKHAKIRWAHKNPIKYAWMVLRNNAQRRKKFFDLTLEQFTKFALANGYMVGKGKGALDLTIDRRENKLGYTINNLRVLTNAENARKKDRPLETEADPY